MKNLICCFSGKPVGSQNVVLVEYAVEYLRSRGYVVSNKPFGGSE